MMRPWEIIKLLESDNSRLFKEKIIKDQLIVDNKELFEGFKYCLDSLKTFGVKKVPESTVDGEGLNWNSFESVLKEFINREITGNAALHLINAMMNESTKDQWNYWYRRILIKDLRCGVSEKTINNVVGKHEYQIPVFTCQLASSSEDHQKKMIGEKIVDVKMDGSRILSVLYPNGNVEQFSRNGKVISNFPKIVSQLKILTSKIDFPIVLDGEIMSSSFQDLMKQLHRKEEVKTDDAVLHLFDMLSLASFRDGHCHKSQILRRNDLENLFRKINPLDVENVDIIDYEIINLDNKKGNDRLLEINKFAIEAGYEGIMIKDIDAPYECKRSTNWLKLKPFITVDLEVIDVQEGTGKYAGVLGAIICSGIDQDKKITVNVGSGITDDQRKYYWSHKDEILNKIVEIKADAITHSQEENDDYSLRFPVFLKVRNDK